MAGAPGNVNCQPYFLKTPDRYLVDQARMYHNDSVFALGEYSIFNLLWTITDYQAGTVQRCPWCSDRSDSTGIDKQIFDVYAQPAQYNCAYCYGTTFFKTDAPSLGGLKAQIIRPCMWNPTDEEHKLAGQGEFITSQSDVQSTSDFRMRSGDFVFKADGTRWRIQEYVTATLISGLQAANDINAMIGYHYPGAIRQDESSVAYLIPPSSPEVISLIDTALVPNYPICFENYETYNATNLVGDDYTPGA